MSFHLLCTCYRNTASTKQSHKVRLHIFLSSNWCVGPDEPDHYCAKDRELQTQVLDPNFLHQPSPASQHNASTTHKSGEQPQLVVHQSHRSASCHDTNCTEDIGPALHAVRDAIDEALAPSQTTQISEIQNERYTNLPEALRKGISPCLHIPAKRTV